MRFLMKFGGTSVADAGSISHVTDLVRSCRESGNEVAVVVSAQRGVTDQLISIANEIVKTPDNQAVEPFIHSLRSRHMKVLREAAVDQVMDVQPAIEVLLENLE